MEFLSPSLWFEKLGFEYFGPLDGHNLKTILSFLDKIKDIQQPVLLHLYTTKGRGLSYAERDSLKYHGVTPFEKKQGSLKPKKNLVNPTLLCGESISQKFSRKTKKCLLLVLL